MARAKKRRQHSAEFKARVALAAIAGPMTAPQVAEHFGIHRNLVLQWRAFLIRRAARAFEPDPGEVAAEPMPSAEPAVAFAAEPESSIT